MEINPRCSLNQGSHEIIQDNTLFFLLILCFTPVLASDIGSIKNVEGQALILRGEKQLPAQAGSRLLVDDILRTGDDGAMGIILQDL